jgi:hypothetical protein
MGHAAGHLKCCLGSGRVRDKRLRMMTIWAGKMELNDFNGSAKVKAGHAE